MKTYQMDGKPDILEFTNYQRIDEEELFKHVMEELRKNPGVTIVEMQEGPSEDMYKCQLDKSPFVVIFDVDYGPSIRSTDPKVIEKLKKYFD